MCGRERLKKDVEVDEDDDEEDALERETKRQNQIMQMHVGL